MFTSNCDNFIIVMIMTVRFSIIKGVVSPFPVTGERPESLDKELNSRRERESTTKITKISEGYLVRENVKSLSNSVTKFCDQGICEEFHFFRH